MARARDIANLINSGTFLTPASASATYTSLDDRALVLLNKTEFETVSSISVNNVFTSTYETYKIFINVHTNNDTWIDFRYRANGTDDSGSYYRHRYYSIGSSLSSFAETTGTRLRIGYPSNVQLQIIEMTVMNPAQAIKTSHVSVASGYSSTAYFSASGGCTTQTTSYDGFTIFPDASTITGGFISVYGHKNEV